MTPEEITPAFEKQIRTAVRDLAFEPCWEEKLRSGVEKSMGFQDLILNELPRRCRDEEEFWAGLRQHADALWRQWHKLCRAAEHRSGAAGLFARRAMQKACERLYHRIVEHITEYAPRTPEKAHFRLGIEHAGADCSELLDRIEGLYESIKRQGALPEIKYDFEVPERKTNVNFAVIYGGGWNVSAYSILDAAAKIEGLNALVAFDHPGRSLFAQSGRHTVRLASSGLIRDSAGKYILASFRKPLLLHFVCPHRWSGPAPHDIGVPVLRSELIARLTNYKYLTTEALRSFRDEQDIGLNLIDEGFLPRPDFPCDPERVGREAELAVGKLAARGAREVVVKPARGEQSREVKIFSLPGEKSAAARHAVDLALDYGALLQERVRPGCGADYNWRVFVAASAAGEPEVTGRFARIGLGEDMEMVAEQDMLRRAGMGRREGENLLKRLNEASLHAFRAISYYAKKHRGDLPRAPLGNVGDYATPYFLGIDLIGDARIMEVNGDEVAGMWTDDRLYPDTRGRSFSPVLRSAMEAAGAYKRALGHPAY